jgi:hypothetical protein
MSQFSLAAFVTVFPVALDKTKPSTNPGLRENALFDSITYKTFPWAIYRLLQSHQIIFTALLCFLILLADKIVGAVRMNEFLYLLHCPHSMAMANPVPEWLTDSCCGAATGLASFGCLQITHTRYHNVHKPREKWCDLATPQNEKLPFDDRQERFPGIVGNSCTSTGSYRQRSHFIYCESNRCEIN